MVLLSKLDELHERIVELSSEPTNLAEYERLRPQLAALDGLKTVLRTTAELTPLIEALQAQQRMHDVYAKQLAVAADRQATELAGALRELHSLQTALVADLASLMTRAMADHEVQLAKERDARALAERETSELLEAAEALEKQARSGACDASTFEPRASYVMQACCPSLGGTSGGGKFAYHCCSSSWNTCNNINSRAIGHGSI